MIPTTVTADDVLALNQEQTTGSLIHLTWKPLNEPASMFVKDDVKAKLVGSSAVGSKVMPVSSCIAADQPKSHDLHRLFACPAKPLR